MWYLNACRSCLTTQGKLIRIGLQARKLFCIITGLELEEDDGFPQYFCAECFVLIKKALQFRRRSRRAHFVLKEIYAVKKQVAQADVEIVNRHKTNLISPYSLWKPENAGAYSYKTADAVEVQLEEISPDIEEALKESLTSDIKNEFEIQCDIKAKSIKIEFLGQPSVSNNNVLKSMASKIEEDDKAEELVKQEVNVLKSSSILVDIKPANWREIEKEEEERKNRERLAEIEAALLDIHGDDYYHDDDAANNDFVPEDIDMEDVFKGLKEESPKDSESEPEFEPVVKSDPEPKQAKVKRKRSHCRKFFDEENKFALYFVHGVRSSLILEYVFTHMKITLLTLEEQRETFNKVLNTEPFCRAPFKCNICVMVFGDVQLLYKHVDYHNDKLKYEFGCPVCSDRFPTEEQLNQHAAFKHWYQYKCSRCRGKHHTLDSVVKCFKSMKNPTQFDNNFKIRPLPPKAIYSTLDAWTGDKKGSHAACQQCKIYFNGKISYKLHLERHAGPLHGKYLECDVCSLKFPNHDKLQAHMCSWHLFRYSCRKCKVQFLNRTQARNHLTLGSCSLICYICNTSFESKSKRLNHASSAHRTDCGVCGLLFTNHVKMYIHQFRTHGYFRLNTEAELYDVRFYCKACAVYFMDEKLLFQHLCRMRHEAAREYENGCRSCMLLFDSAAARAEHRLTCENTYPKQCEFCITIVPDKDSYQEHKVEQHKHRAPVIPLAGDSRLCDICGKTVKHIKQHVKTHTVAAEVTIQCKFCPTKSLSYTQHVSHVIFNHTARPYKCTLCQQRFEYRTSCREHILKTHAPVLLYGCEACARRFSHLDYLHDHCRKIHNVDLKKQDKSVFLSKRMFGKIYTYPHMNIDGSHIDISVLEQTPIELCDYLDENEKRVPYTDAFFFDLNVNPITPSSLSNNKKKKKATKEQARARYLRKRQRIMMKRAAMKENAAEQSMPNIETIEIDNDNKQKESEDTIVGDTDNLAVNESLDINEQEVEVETEDIVGQLIEKDGQYFVLANDVLYTLEDDCVERLQEKDGVMQIVNE